MTRVRTYGLVSVLAVVATASPTTANHREVIYPELAGTTVIHSEGVTGIALRVPSEIRIFNSNIQLGAAPETGYAMVKIGDPNGPYEGLCDMCFLNWSEYLKDPHYDGDVVNYGCSGAPNQDIGCLHEPGIIEIYLASDGPITFVLTLPDLSGSVEVTATGEVDGILDPVAATGCIPNACSGNSRIVWGGKAHPAGSETRGGWARLRVKYIAPPSQPFPNEGKVLTCRYSPPAASPTPSDHPFGCDGWHPDDPKRDPFVASSFWRPNPGPFGQAMEVSAIDMTPGGPVYFGFAIRLVDTLGTPSYVKAWGLWLSEGISCPSGDFFDCSKPHE